MANITEMLASLANRPPTTSAPRRDGQRAYGG